MNEFQASYTGVTREERMWAAILHLSAFAGFLLPVVGQIVGPLVIWLLKRDESAYIDAHGKEALNFQISTLIYGVVSFILAFMLIGIPLLFALGIFWLICIVIAAVKANDGQPFQYPLSIRFL